MQTKIHILLLGLLGLSVWMSYSLYTPIPEGFSDPWAIRSLHIRLQGRITLGRWLDRLGIMKLNDFINSTFAGTPVSVPGIDAKDAYVHNVPVRIRTKQERGNSNKLPAFIFYHGGGYLFGDRYMHEHFLSELVKDLDAVVISVTYRLAPRDIWPAQLEDGVAVAKYFIENAEEHGIDKNRISVGGDSAGGNLAAAVNLKLSDDDFPFRPKSQVLIYPVCQLFDFSLPSHIQNSAGPVIPRDFILFATSNLLLGNNSVAHFLENNNHVTREYQQKARRRIAHDELPSDLKYNPYASPQPISDGSKEVWDRMKVAMTSHLNIMMSDHLNSQPRTYIFTAQYDPLRDDGYLYAKALRDAGVEVTHFNHPKGVHGLMRFFKTTPEGRELYISMLNFLKKHL